MPSAETVPLMWFVNVPSKSEYQPQGKATV